MPFACEIGQRVRARRLTKGWTQRQLADALGLCHQQIQRYESGADQISAPRLNEIAIALEVSPVVLFPPHVGGGAGTNIHGVTDELIVLIDRPDTIKLLRAFANVKGKNRRAQVVAFVEAFADRPS